MRGRGVDASKTLFYMEVKLTEEKKLLTVKETSKYLNLGDTKTRQLLRGQNGFGVQIGNRWYANKTKLDKWIDRNSI